MVAPVTKLNLLTDWALTVSSTRRARRVVALDGGAVHPHFEAERLPAVSRAGEGSDGGAGQTAFPDP
jgi:hypothetical protein